MIQTTRTEPLRIEVVGDSILRGIQVDGATGRYVISNNIDTVYLAKKHRLSISNRSSFGCTVTRGYNVVKRFLEQGGSCDVVIMDFGGNDCDFNWKEIAENPYAHHDPRTPEAEFRRVYAELIHLLRIHGISPVITTLPPLDAELFFRWFCDGLNTENIMKWLKRREVIFEHHAAYSQVAAEIAKEEGVSLVDIRNAFLRDGQKQLNRFLCCDGTHPNTEGQRIITEVFDAFAEHRLGQEQYPA